MSVADPDSVLARMRALGGSWPTPTILDTVDSTNRALAEQEHCIDGQCVVSDEQTAGRGRVDRSWVSNAGAGLWMSVCVSLEGVVPENWPLLSATAAVAARTALSNACDVTVGIKWPNDLVVEPSLRKIGGLLTEVVGNCAVVGIGINVAWPAQELPTPESTSVLVEGGRIDRGELLAHVLVELERCVERWRRSPEDALDEFRRSCVSLGREVLVLLPDGSTLAGTATDVDHGGRLILVSGETPVFISAGDVIHATITPWDTPRNS